MKILIHRQEAYVLTDPVKDINIESFLDELPDGAYRITVKLGGRNDNDYGEVSKLFLKHSLKDYMVRAYTPSGNPVVFYITAKDDTVAEIFAKQQCHISKFDFVSVKLD